MMEDLKVRIPGSFMRVLQQQAAAEMLTVSDIVRKALRKHVEQTTKEDK